MRKFLFILAMAFCISPLLFSQTGRNTRYVAVQSVPVKDSTGFFAQELGNLPLGTEVTVIRENGKWTEVRTGNLGGWVASSSLSARRVIGSNAEVIASEIAMAGKGFSPDMEIEYKKGGLDYSMVDYMERINIPADDLLNFITEGRLARGE